MHLDFFRKNLYFHLYISSSRRQLGTCNNVHTRRLILWHIKYSFWKKSNLSYVDLYVNILYLDLSCKKSVTFIFLLLSTMSIHYEYFLHGPFGTIFCFIIWIFSHKYYILFDVYHHHHNLKLNVRLLWLLVPLYILLQFPFYFTIAQDFKLIKSLFFSFEI